MLYRFTRFYEPLQGQKQGFANFMTSKLMWIVKINFELSVLSMNAPFRVEKILGEILETGNFEYLFMRVSQYLEQCIISGVVPPG